MSNLTPSPEQQAVLGWEHNGNTRHAIVQAVAGSGKTTVLDMYCGVVDPSLDIIYLVFNRSNYLEALDRLRHHANVTVSTFHSLGKRVLEQWLEVRPKVDKNARKWAMLNACKVPKELHKAVEHLVSLGKQTGVGVLWDTCEFDQWESIIDRFDVLSEVKCEGVGLQPRVGLIEALSCYAAEGVSWSHRKKNLDAIDFDDMLWLPLLYDLDYPKYHRVLVDEYQDTNAVRRMTARKLMHDDIDRTPGDAQIALLVEEFPTEPLPSRSRSVWVGDANQAIYAFTGADDRAMDLVKTELDDLGGVTVLPLNESYRCSKAAVGVAKRWVPNMVAHDNNATGVVASMRVITFATYFVHSCPDPGSCICLMCSTAYTFDEVRDGTAKDGCEGCTRAAESGDYSSWVSRSSLTPQGLLPSDAILCRNTRPLVSLAFQLLRNRTPCYVEGSDIGKQLENLVTRWKVSTVMELLVCLRAYRKAETERLEKQGNEYAIESLNDRVDSILVLCEFSCLDGATVGDVLGRLREMFTSNNGVCLSTIHRAKGREWPRVWLLGFNELLPSKRATQPWQKQQERNLQYVAVTRTKHALITVELA